MLHNYLDGDVDHLPDDDMAAYVYGLHWHLRRIADDLMGLDGADRGARAADAAK